ncbi:SDR family oxidoreductase [Nocardia sp. NPDC051321]|uniref:SDR family oxidoreductase n=1 Tax=Nocardia sp. NPDC051321 TaxID=3364323 RepID=UPI00379619C4
MSGYLVTGATGFVGGALTLELLEHTDAPVHLLVRAGGSAAADRCRSALQAAAESYGLERDFVHRHRDRIRVVSGDLTDAHVAEHLPSRGITDVWHCAASLKFGNRNRDEIFAVNVDGTARLLDLSEKIGVTRFNYVSTAYVAGDAVGRIEESAVPLDANSTNQYELSKIVAERVVSKRDSMSTCIWRPSVVVGHSRTLATTSFTGLYGMVREGLRFKRRAEILLGAPLALPRVHIVADPAAETNLIPIDIMVQQAVSLSTRPGFDAKIVHLTNASAPLVGDLLSVVAAAAGIRGLDYVDSPDGFTAIERRFHKTMQFYGQHAGATKSFAQDVADQYGSAIHFPMDVEYLRSLVGWYVDHAGLADLTKAARLPRTVFH